MPTLILRLISVDLSISAKDTSGESPLDHARQYLEYRSGLLGSGSFFDWLRSMVMLAEDATAAYERVSHAAHHHDHHTPSYNDTRRGRSTLQVGRRWSNKAIVVSPQIYDRIALPTFDSVDFPPLTPIDVPTQNVWSPIRLAQSAVKQAPGQATQPSTTRFRNVKLPSPLWESNTRVQYSRNFQFQLGPPSKGNWWKWTVLERRIPRLRGGTNTDGNLRSCETSDT